MFVFGASKTFGVEVYNSSLFSFQSVNSAVD